MPYQNLRGHDAFCHYVQTIDFDSLAREARMSFVQREYSSLFRLHDHDALDKPITIDTVLEGYDGDKAGRKPFIIARLSKLVGIDSPYPLEEARSVWLEILDMLFAGVAFQVFDGAHIKAEFAVTVDVTKGVQRFGCSMGSRTPLTGAEWAEALVRMADLDFCCNLDQIQEATQKFGLVGTSLKKPARWCRLLHVYSVVFMRAGGEASSPLKFRGSSSAGDTRPQRDAGARALLAAANRFTVPGS